ncbi:MAG TPA: DNA repair protein RecO, partial [Alphaproteobacteria bacterium]|nr:DNA repair protein RecO [Alphaproteobacteria bacterium]
MPEWSDTALILERRPHGESNAVVTVLSQSYGRHAGLVHAAASRSKKGMLELGNLV